MLKQLCIGTAGLYLAYSFTSVPTLCDQAETTVALLCPLSLPNGAVGWSAVCNCCDYFLHSSDIHLFF